MSDIDTKARAAAEELAQWGLHAGAKEREAWIRMAAKKLRRHFAPAWRDARTDPPPTPEHSQTYAVLVEGVGDAPKVMAMDWRFHKFAATPKGRGPRWEWHLRISPWNVIGWTELPHPPKEGAV